MEHAHGISIDCFFTGITLILKTKSFIITIFDLIVFSPFYFIVVALSINFKTHFGTRFSPKLYFYKDIGNDRFHASKAN
jgi:hypothetical protein